MFTFHDLLHDNLLEIAHHLNPADHIMLALACRYTLSCLHPPRGLDALVTTMYHHGNLRQLTYFEKKWRTQYDDAIMISRWKGQLLRIVDDWNEWKRLPPYVGQFSLLSELHLYGVLLWCVRQPVWCKISRQLHLRYAGLGNVMGSHCDDWYLEDLAVNFREHVRPREVQRWGCVFKQYTFETEWWGRFAKISNMEPVEYFNETRARCVGKKEYCRCLECVTDDGY